MMTETIYGPFRPAFLTVRGDRMREAIGFDLPTDSYRPRCNMFGIQEYHDRLIARMAEFGAVSFDLARDDYPSGIQLSETSLRVTFVDDWAAAEFALRYA
jgi:hypothetical protein